MRIDPMEANLRKTGSKGWLALLLMILLFGSGLRGRWITDGIFGDESFHVAAAISLLNGEGAKLSPGYPYERALPFTEAVRVSSFLFGTEEWAFRVPSFLSSILVIGLVFLLGKEWIDRTTGLIAAFFSACDPMSVFMGSYARFYSSALLLLLIAALAFRRGLEAWKRGEHRQMLAWAAASAASIGSALVLQVISADLMLGILVFMVLDLIRAAVIEGPRTASRRPEGILAILGTIGIGLALVFTRFFWADGWRLALQAPLWNMREGPDYFYYLHFLKSYYFPVVILFMAGCGIALLKKRRGVLLAGVIFCSALLAHSVVFQSKSPRYLFLVMPFLLLPAAYTVRYLGSSVADRWLGTESPRKRALLFLTFAAGFFLLSGWGSADVHHRLASRVDWRGAILSLGDRIRDRDYVVCGVADDLFPIRYYVGRADAHMGTEDWILEHDPYRSVRRRPGMGPYDLPCISDENTLRGLAENSSRIWLIFKNNNLKRGSRISPAAMLRSLRNREGVLVHTWDRVVVLEMPVGRTGTGRPAGGNGRGEAGDGR